VATTSAPKIDRPPRSRHRVLRVEDDLNRSAAFTTALQRLSRLAEGMSEAVKADCR